MKLRRETIEEKELGQLRLSQLLPSSLLKLQVRVREAISLTPRLQPGVQLRQKYFLNRFKRFLEVILAKQKPLETVPCQFRFADHRAEAPVLMKSLRVSPFKLYVRASSRYLAFELSTGPLLGSSLRFHKICLLLKATLAVHVAK